MTRAKTIGLVLSAFVLGSLWNPIQLTIHDNSQRELTVRVPQDQHEPGPSGLATMDVGMYHVYAVAEMSDTTTGLPVYWMVGYKMDSVNSHLPLQIYSVPRVVGKVQTGKVNLLVHVHTDDRSQG